MHMADWITKLDDFLRLSERDILTHAGRISHQQADDHAHAQYEIHEHRRRELESANTSDFDEAAKWLTEQAPPPKPRGIGPRARRRKKKPDDQAGTDA
jgi:hypothetical protein